MRSYAQSALAWARKAFGLKYTRDHWFQWRSVVFAREEGQGNEFIDGALDTAMLRVLRLGHLLKRNPDRVPAPTRAVGPTGLATVTSNISEKGLYLLLSLHRTQWSVITSCVSGRECVCVIGHIPPGCGPGLISVSLQPIDHWNGNIQRAMLHLYRLKAGDLDKMKAFSASVG